MRDTTPTRYPIWKVESADTEQANQGEFCLRYMLSVISKQTLYLGRCSCKAARVLNTPIIAFAKTADCFHCGSQVTLDPVPRIEDGRWVSGNVPEVEEDFF